MLEIYHEQTDRPLKCGRESWNRNSWLLSAFSKLFLSKQRVLNCSRYCSICHQFTGQHFEESFLMEAVDSVPEDLSPTTLWGSIAAESHLMKLQRLQNKVPRTIVNFPRHTSVRDMHVAFQIPYVYDYITKSTSNKQKSSKIMKMKMFVTLDKARPHTESVRGLNLAAVMCTTVQVSNTAVVD
jgi:hypothetical protein